MPGSSFSDDSDRSRTERCSGEARVDASACRVSPPTSAACGAGDRSNEDRLGAGARSILADIGSRTGELVVGSAVDVC